MKFEDLKWKESSYIIGFIVLLALGVFLSFLKEYPLSFFCVTLGFAILSIGLAFNAIDIANDSNKKMEALANLNFIEKHAMLQQYINEFKCQNFDNIHKCELDLKATLEIKDWIDPEKKEKLIKDVIKLIGGGLSNQYYFDLERVKPFLKEILETSLKFNLKTNELNILKKHLMNLKQKSPSVE